MNAAHIEAISLPADLTARAFYRANFIAIGIVSFSQEGIKYLPDSHFMRFILKNNLANKRIWKYQIGQTIKYGGIVDVLPLKNNCLEFVTDRVNGSYYFSVPYSQSDSLSDICAFIQRCREEGFDRAVQDQVLFKKVESHCVKAKKAMIASLVISWYLSLFIGLFLAFYAPITAKQSGSRILYVIALVLLIAIFMLMFLLYI